MENLLWSMFKMLHSEVSNRWGTALKITNTMLKKAFPVQTLFEFFKSKNVSTGNLRCLIEQLHFSVGRLWDFKGILQNNPKTLIQMKS